MTPVGAALEPPPAEVGARLARCPVVDGDPSVAAFAAESFRPIFRDDEGTLRELPLEAADVACLHNSLRATLDFAWHAYGVLRTVPKTKGVKEPAKQGWTALDTAATVRARGSIAYDFLAEGTEREERGRHLIKVFDPLLHSAGELWLDAVVRSSSLDGLAAWQVPPKAGRYVRGVAALTGGFFDRVGPTLRLTGEEDVRFAAWRRALDFAFAATAVMAMPTLATYTSYHGTHAIELVEPRMGALCAHLRALLGGQWVDLLQTISRGTPEAFRRLYGEVIDRREQVGCNLVRAVLAAPPRSRFNVQEFRGRTQLEFRTHENRRQIERAVQADSVARKKPLEPEIYWALPQAWERLRRASDLVNDAGFALVINAGNNRWGGKHPPHATHSNGRCFDLDIIVPVAPGNVESLFNGRDGRDYRRVFNLMKLVRRDGKNGEFSDEAGNRFDLVPAKGATPAARTQRGVDRLALWVALQALQLAGMNNVLYSDFENMDGALRHLVGRLLRQSLQSVATRHKNLPRPGEPRQLLEPEAHFDHLHAEAPQLADGAVVAPGEFTESRSFASLHERLLERARDRDQNPVFLEFAFGRASETSSLEVRYRPHWTQRASEGRPALLPLFEPSLCTRLDSAGRCVPG